MKKNVLTLVLVLIIFFLPAQIAGAETPLIAGGNCGIDGDNLRWELDANGILTISGNGVMMNWSALNVVPWHSYGNSIKTVIIENGVTSIGDCAFKAFKNLREVEVPDTVERIGKSAFALCNRLSIIEIGNNIKCIDSYAFEYCNGLNGSLYIPNGVEIIGEGAFERCEISSVEVPGSVESIGEAAFWNCNKLEKVIIHHGVKVIEPSTFYNCEMLTDIEIPNSVQVIGDKAFYGCSWLRDIKIPDGITQISNYAFYGCDSLYNIEIPNSVTTIGNYAFWACQNLESIQTPKNLTTIGDEAFYHCSNLTKILISDSVTAIRERAFDKCDKITDVYYAGTKDLWNKISISMYNTSITNANIHYNSQGINDPKVENINVFDGEKSNKVISVSLSDLEYDSVLFVACYRENMLVDINIIPLTAVSDSHIDLEIYNLFDELKLFIWGDNMRPITYAER